MHEWSLALSIVKSVDKWAFENGVEIKKITLSIPKPAMLDVAVLKEAFDFLKKESRLENAALEVEVREPVYKCRSCGYVFHHGDVLKDIETLAKTYGEEYPLHVVPELLPTFIKCPRCKSHDIEADLSIRIEKIEV
ncbi:MAG: hydrogenase maturation nickel metallochaperone HypA [Pyrobaculum sp.]